LNKNLKLGEKRLPINECSRKGKMERREADWENSKKAIGDIWGSRLPKGKPLKFLEEKVFRRGHNGGKGKNKGGYPPRKFHSSP